MPGTTSASRSRISRSRRPALGLAVRQMDRLLGSRLRVPRSTCPTGSSRSRSSRSERSATRAGFRRTCASASCVRAGVGRSPRRCSAGALELVASDEPDHSHTTSVSSPTAEPGSPSASRQIVDVAAPEALVGGPPIGMAGEALALGTRELVAHLGAADDLDPRRLDDAHAAARANRG